MWQPCLILASKETNVPGKKNLTMCYFKVADLTLSAVTQRWKKIKKRFSAVDKNDMPPNCILLFSKAPNLLHYFLKNHRRLSMTLAIANLPLLTRLTNLRYHWNFIKSTLHVSQIRTIEHGLWVACLPTIVNSTFSWSGMPDSSQILTWSRSMNCLQRSRK